jgi:cytochrome P450
MYGLMLAEVGLIVLLGLFVVRPVYVYAKDPKGLRRFPAVPIASLTNAWNFIHQLLSTRTVAVHDAHMKYGKIVRIGPKHVSMATPQAVKDIYGHGTPATKDNFYGAFASTHLNVSDSQEKSVHNTKRKRFAVAFAQKSVTELEYVAQEHLQRLVNILDARITAPLKSTSELPDPKDMVDMKSQMVYLMYDIMSVMLFSQDPDFLRRQTTMTTAETVAGKLYQADVHKVLKGSLAVSATLGWAPEWMKVNKILTGWHSMWKAGDELRDVTIHLLRNRIRMENEQLAAGGKPIVDMFSTLLWNRDREPLGLEFGELVTEASNLFNAAGENNEIALTNIIWLLARTPKAAAKLREEVDEAFDNSDSSIVPAYDTIKDLPYLRACIDEGLRLRPSLQGGLPRVTPESGMSVGGQWLEGGTTVSVSTYTIHRDPEIFHDPYEYIPDRWLESGANEMQKVFLPFSQGGRACLGRNIAYFEMSLVIATLFRRYEFVLPKPNWDLEVAETMSAHTGPLPLKIWRRDVKC